MGKQNRFEKVPCVCAGRPPHPSSRTNSPKATISSKMVKVQFQLNWHLSQNGYGADFALIHANRNSSTLRDVVFKSTNTSSITGTKFR